jgi:hypothetical protein
VVRGIADPNTPAIMGSSYAGYAAMELLRNHLLFKACIVERAMLDIAYQLPHLPNSYHPHLALLKRYFGVAKDSDDLEHINSLEAATFMAADKRRGVFNFKKAEKNITKADAANKISIGFS